MKELKDYSGPYVPNLRYEDFSKEVLVKLLRAYSKEVNLLAAYWGEEVRNRLGREAEKECLLSTWKRMGRHETGWAIEAAGISGNDVETYVKATQLMGSFAQGFFKYDFDLKSRNHAILTVNHCPAFESLEKLGDLDYLDWVCTVLEEEAMKSYVRPVNPDIEVKCLRAGRRQSKEEVHCRWEFRLKQ